MVSVSLGGTFGTLWSSWLVTLQCINTSDESSDRQTFVRLSEFCILGVMELWNYCKIHLFNQICPDWCEHIVLFST